MHAPTLRCVVDVATDFLPMFWKKFDVPAGKIGMFASAYGRAFALVYTCVGTTSGFPPCCETDLVKRPARG
jgi:hypothetical protein